MVKFFSFLIQTAWSDCFSRPRPSCSGRFIFLELNLLRSEKVWARFRGLSLQVGQRFPSGGVQDNVLPESLLRGCKRTTDSQIGHKRVLFKLQVLAAADAGEVWSSPGLCVRKIGNDPLPAT
jgi:hypothetical protein